MSWYRLLPAHMRDRYTFLYRISEGGQGEVWCAFDEHLNREVAAKIMRAPAAAQERSSSAELRRFHREVTVSARLDHPGVLPVYDHAILMDGRPIFLMRLVRGERTLDAVFPGSAGTEQERRRRVSTLLRAAEALAHAHSRGIVHRDVKPDNVLVASTGEVYVVDWGLARIGAADEHDEGPSVGDAAQTLRGVIGGTPGWMAPEAATVGLRELGATADVYGLCAVLYRLMCGRPPWAASTLDALLDELTRRPMPEIPDDIPDDLRNVLLRGLDPDPGMRPADAAALGAEFSDWLDGVQRRERAIEILRAAHEPAVRLEGVRAQASMLRQAGQRALRDLPTWAGVEERRPSWDQLDTAEALERTLRIGQVERERQLHAALELAPDLEEARGALADLYRDRLLDAERGRRWQAAEEASAQLAAFGGGRHASVLIGDGAFTLVTDPPGATVEVLRYVEVDHRLVAMPFRVLGPTPLHDQPLPMGSYLMIIRAAGRDPVRYPVHIPRCGTWDGRPPGASEPYPVWLPREGVIAEDERYIPAGWFQAGDAAARGGQDEARVWVPEFAIATNPVTNAEYLDFLNDLAETSGVEQALSVAPRELGPRRDRPGEAIFRPGPSGRFEIHPDVDGDRWDPQWPVVLIDHACARAYAAWRATARREAWRLPFELEWEKAARGVDGRLFPWGDRDETIFACLAGSRKTAKNLPVRVTEHETDVSPFGVRHMAGLARTWCLDGFYQTGDQTTPSGQRGLDAQLTDEDYRVCRGGAWNASSMYARCGYRMGLPPHSRLGVVGVRVARSLSR